MAQAKTTGGTSALKNSKYSDRLPALREFIQDNDQRLYDFCYYVMRASPVCDEIVLEIFRAFGEYYRRHYAKGQVAGTPNELTLRLFEIAWQCLREAALSELPLWASGRDTRQMKGQEIDLLEKMKRAKAPLNLPDEEIIQRFEQLDLDLLAPLVLKDILKFDDEEVATILGVRWGVYRHRLHRGRLELKDSLQGAHAYDGRKSPEGPPA